MGRGLLAVLVAAVFAAFAWGRDYSVAGAYQAGWREVTVSRPGGSTFGALLYYPAQAAGQNAAIDLQAGPCQAVSFGHGFVVNPDKYRSTFAHLASWGYVVIASRSNGGLFPDHQDFADDLRHCLTWLIEQSQNPASFLYEFVDGEAMGLSGHSMGGGASILAATEESRVKAVANLAAADTNPSAVTAMASVNVPISLISGSDDSIVPVGSHGQLMYNNGSAPKQLPVIAGASHCGFLDSDIIFCDSGSIGRDEQLAITRHLLTAFFELHLKGDLSAWPQVWGPEMKNDNRWTVQLSTCFEADFDTECCITWTDMQAFFPYWLAGPCEVPGWCGGRDFDRSGQVDLTDFWQVSQDWLTCISD